MTSYNIVASTEECTVVAEYVSDKKRETGYQSEAQLEAEFINILKSLGYEYVSIHTEEELILNLRKQLEKLNNYSFSDDEWKRFFHNNIASNNDGIVEKTRKIQKDYIQVLKCDDNSSMNIRLLNKDNIHNNRLQVINQYETEEGKHKNRYDVTVLVNGLPLVHIELKRRGVPIKEAFNQINRYQNESFWSGSGLFQYVQIFVISNGTETKYYSNTTREGRMNEAQSVGGSGRKTSNSFEFTSYWADATNKIIPDLVDFAKTFFAKHAILSILTKYCVFDSDNKLLVLRPYQIAACERILNRIETSSNYKKEGTKDAGGFIWHTTGSGKTLTSFKTAQLAMKMPGIDKVIFVVDRKDLDYQTMKEYDRFEKGAANSNTSTSKLKKQLEDESAKIIITTIQKLSIFVGNNNKGHEVFKKHVVLIFDECHRSQFGEMHQRITKNFKRYHIFGFTGTPIFTQNATLLTTEQTFGEMLHKYTIINAIQDKNVLPFLIDYHSTIQEKEGIQEEKVWDIDREKILLADERIKMIVDYILRHFNQKTKRQRGTKDYAEYSVKGDKKTGFNSIFAVSSIDAAKKYYAEFKKQKGNPEYPDLKIGLIYSFGINDDSNSIEEENPESTEGLDASSREFLDKAIDDYNEMFKTNFDTSSDGFQDYYKDVSQRLKKKELDMLIVVNMFLTGFDATTLNTLWVDKNLKNHGLLQAFSRTNRILNEVKTFGNIVCFRNLQTATEEAIALFGDKDAGGIVLLKSFKDYYEGYDDAEGHHPGYTEIVSELEEKFPIESFAEHTVGESSVKEFIMLFGSLLRIKNILSVFDEFTDDKMTERDFQDYMSKYVDLHAIWPRQQQSIGEKENVNDDIVFEMALVSQIAVDCDYILRMVEKYHDTNCADKEILSDIRRAIESSPELRSKKDLIESFIEKINAGGIASIEEWEKHLAERKEAELSKIIGEEKLKEEEAREFIDRAFENGSLKTYGSEIDEILPPISRFGANGNERQTKKIHVTDILEAFFRKYNGV